MGDFLPECKRIIESKIILIRMVRMRKPYQHKLTFCFGMLILLLWSGISEAQSRSGYGRAVRNKFTSLNPYKIGQFDYKRPYSFLKGRNWRLKFLTPIYDTTKYTDDPLDRDQKFEGYEEGQSPYSVFVSYKWLGVGKTSLAYRINTNPNFKYHFNMEFQDFGLTFGLQKRFLYRKGKRKYGGVSSVYRSNLTLGYGRMVNGEVTIDYTVEGIGVSNVTVLKEKFRRGDTWFLIYGWEVFQGDSISIEAAAGYRENNIIYNPPSVVGDPSLTTDEPIQGDFNQIMFGFGVSF